jgi:hypothetical protein
MVGAECEASSAQPVPDDALCADTADTADTADDSAVGPGTGDTHDRRPRGTAPIAAKRSIQRPAAHR